VPDGAREAIALLEEAFLVAPLGKLQDLGALETIAHYLCASQTGQQVD
jgi:hypothetical protein